MNCFQWEQTAKCAGCTGTVDVCGKKADTAALQDKLTGVLIGLARATDGNEHLINHDASMVIIESLFATQTNVDFDNAALEGLLERVTAEKKKMVPDCFVCACPCGKTFDYDMQKLWNADEDIRSLKSRILFGIRGMAAYAYPAAVLGCRDEEVERFLYKALIVIGMDDFGMADLQPIVLEVDEKNLKCMALLDRANAGTFGHPQPTAVSLTAED